MSISLRKGKMIKSSKNGGPDGQTRAFMSAGWDQAKSSGTTDRLFGGEGGQIDLNGSAVSLYTGMPVFNTIFFDSLRSAEGAVSHRGDNLTGEGDCDDEVIDVDLVKLRSAARHLVFTVTSSRGQTFVEADNVFAHLANATINREICSFVLSEDGKHIGVIMASAHQNRHSLGDDGSRK